MSNKFVSLLLIIILLFILYCYQQGYIEINLHFPFTKSKKKKVKFIDEEQQINEENNDSQSINMDDISISDLDN